jgi:glycosyltransferase involved in cell wall biosynthesis
MADRLTGPSMLALVGDLSGPALWRILQPISALERAGYPCGWDRTQNHAVSAIAGRYQGIILPRVSWPIAFRPTASAWLAEIRARGQVIVYEADDDLFSTAMVAHGLAAGLTPKTFRQLDADRHDLHWLLGQVDGVTVSTPYLAEIVRGFTDRPVVVVPNAIDVSWFRSVLRAATRPSPACTIGWAGGKRDERDLAPLGAAWRTIAERYPAVRFLVAGHRSPTLTRAVPADRLEIRPWLPLERYPANLAGLTIGCAALHASAFARSKSDIKALEYAVAGAAVVASPTVYGELVEHGYSGLIAETADEWMLALSALVESPARCAILARRLLRHVERERSLAQNLWRWPAAWSMIAESAKTRRLVMV